MLGKLILLCLGASCLVSAVISCGTPNPNCLVSSDPNACSGKLGDFSLCSPECQEGKYVSCVHDNMFIRDCADGWYYDATGAMFQYPMVFVPGLGCQRSASICPRPLDRRIAA